MKYVGKTIEKGNTIIKDYIQTVSGSAWKKVCADIIFMSEQGFTDIIIRINEDHPNLDVMIGLCKSMNVLVPGLQVQKITKL